MIMNITEFWVWLWP